MKRMHGVNYPAQFEVCFRPFQSDRAGNDVDVLFKGMINSIEENINAVNTDSGSLIIAGTFRTRSEKALASYTFAYYSIKGCVSYKLLGNNGCERYYVCDNLKGSIKITKQKYEEMNQTHILQNTQ